MDKIKLIFNIYKDSVVFSKPFRKEISKKYKLSDEDTRNLFIRIQNYQIKKYGNRLTYDNYNVSSEERIKDSARFRQRRYEKKTRRRNNLLDNYFGDVMKNVDDLVKQAQKLKK